MSQDNTDLVLSGPALVAAVRAAESPVTAAIVKSVFFKQLGIDRMLAIDLDMIDDLPEADLIQVVWPASAAEGTRS